MKELVDAERIGRVRAVHGFFTSPLVRFAAPTNWRYDPHRGGGSIYDTASYLVHFSRFVIGAEPVQVYGTGSFAAEEQAELSAAITLSFPGGAVAHLTSSYEYGYCQATQRRCSAPTVGSASTCPSTSAAYASRSSWRRRTSRPRSASTMTASTPKSTNSHPGTRNQFDLQLEH